MAESPWSIGPAGGYQHAHGDLLHPGAAAPTRGQRVADRVTAAIGSWSFIIVQSILLVCWMAANVWMAVDYAHHVAQHKPFDPYPFILLNLVLSFQAAYTGPVVMMSQNRQAERDRLAAARDLKINEKAEDEVRVIMAHLVHQDRMMCALSKQLSRITDGDDDAEVADTKEVLEQGGELIKGKLAEPIDEA